MLHYKNKKYSKSLESLFRTHGFTNTNVIPDIQKLLNKGENVYCAFCPYTSEINGVAECIYDTNYDDLMERFYNLMEQV